MLFRPALSAMCLAFVICSSVAAQDRSHAPAGLKPLKLKSLPLFGAKSTKASFDTTRSPASKPAKVIDVELTSRRSLVGSLIDGQGRGLAGETVTARFGRRVLAETKTDRLGQFRFQSVRGSLFEVRSRHGRRVVRVWASGTAPKNARRHVLVVDRKPQVRSQSPGPVGPLVVSNGLAEAGLLIGATVGVGAIVLNQTDDTIPPPAPTMQSQSRVQASSFTANALTTGDSILLDSGDSSRLDLSIGRPPMQIDFIPNSN